MIRIIEPHITFGFPSRHMIKNLIYKRGCGKVNRCRIPLTDNSIVANELGKHGINCVEDLIHEIVTCGPKFKEANNFLWPFKLSSPSVDLRSRDTPSVKDTVPTETERSS